jgi:peptide/nickel transport system substrate-binding protein
MRRRTPWIVAMALLVPLMASCGSSNTNSSSSNKIIAIGTLNKFEQPNPFNAFDFTDYFVQTFMYPFLVQYNSAGQIVPDFATSWTVSPDGKTWTFHLKHNAKWSDGKPLTSADVAWTANTTVKYLTGPTAIDSAYVTELKDATTPDPYTVVLHYTAPVASVLASLGDQMPILPEHIWAKHATGNGAGLKSFPNSAPAVSGGPYIFKSFNGTDFALFTQNPTFYGTKPKVSEIGLQYYATADSMIQAIKHGQLDYAEFLPQTSINTVRQAGWVVKTYPSFDEYNLFFNLNPKKTSHRELLNPVVRLAIAHAIDRQDMVKTAFPGSQLGANVVPPAAGQWSDPSIKPESFNLALANHLLDQAGYRRGPNGIRIAGGHPMQYTVLFAGDQTGPGDRVFQILANDLRQIGIVVTQKTLDVAAFGPAIYGTNNSYNGYDIAMEDFGGVFDPSFALSYFTCANLGGWNFSGWCDKHFDALYNQQNATISTSARRALVYQAETYFYNVRPAIVLFYGVSVDVNSPKWTGFGADPYGAFNNLSGKETFLAVHHVGS